MTPSIIDVMNERNLFASWFKVSSWDTWRVFLKALFSLELTDPEREGFTRFTGRESPPEAAKEAWLIVCGVGARMERPHRGAYGHLSGLFSRLRGHLAMSEKATVIAIAADRRQPG